MVYNRCCRCVYDVQIYLSKKKNNNTHTCFTDNMKKRKHEMTNINILK